MTGTPKKALPPTMCVTEEARLSYPALFELDKNGKYKACLIFPNETSKEKLNAAIHACLCEKYPDGKGGYDKTKLGPKFKFPIRDGRDYAEDPTNPRPEYEGTYFINASSKTRPGVVNQNRQPADENEVYAGCWVKAAIKAFYFERDGNRGVSFSLEHIMKVRDDDAFSGRTRVEDVFGAPVDTPAVSGDDFMS